MANEKHLAMTTSTYDMTPSIRGRDWVGCAWRPAAWLVHLAMVAAVIAIAALKPGPGLK